VYVYALLLPTGVPVPDVVEVRGDELVLTKLPGRAFDPQTDDLLQWNREVGALLRRVHGVGFAAFGYIGAGYLVDARATNAAHMRHQFGRKLPAIEDRGLRDAIEQRLDAAEPLLAACTTAALCHNDIHFRNVLVDDHLRITGLIDVENAVAADPLLDLAKAHCYAQPHDESTLAALVSGYGGLRDGWRDALDVYELWHWLELWEWYTGVDHPAAPALLESMRQLV
jgi:hygromycin-B 7''-O-kinase